MEIIGSILSLEIALRFMFSAIKSKISSLRSLSIAFICISIALFCDAMGHVTFWSLEQAKVLFRVYLTLTILALIPAMNFLRQFVEKEIMLQSIIYKILCLFVVFIRLTIVSFEVYEEKIIKRTPAVLSVNGINVDPGLVGILTFWLFIYALYVSINQFKITKNPRKKKLILLKLVGVIVLLCPIIVVILLVSFGILPEEFLVYDLPLTMLAGLAVLSFTYSVNPYIVLILPQKFYSFIVATRDGSKMIEIYLAEELRVISSLISGLIMALNKIGEEVVGTFGKIEKIYFHSLQILVYSTQNFMCLLLVESITPIHRDIMRKICEKIKKLEMLEISEEELLSKIRATAENYFSILLP